MSVRPPLQTGTGTLHTTTISTTAITALIFSLAARLMASSEYDASLSGAALYAASRGHGCDGDHAPTGGRRDFSRPCGARFTDLAAKALN